MNETTSFTYLADGRLNQVTNPNATTTRQTYTTRGFVYEIIHRKSDNTLLSGYRYTYDADGNCTSVALQGGGTTRTYRWGYNNELQQITYGGGGTNTFTYDGSGRRVTKTDSTGSYSFIYDGDRIISSQWYHADGLTSTRTLTNSTQTVTDTFRYDVWGDLAERTGNTPTPHQFVGALGYEREADSGLIFSG